MLEKVTNEGEIKLATRTLKKKERKACAMCMRSHSAEQQRSLVAVELKLNPWPWTSEKIWEEPDT